MSETVISHLTAKIMNMVALEINKKETQMLVRRKIIIPVINLIYSEIYPYIIAIATIISIILLLTLSTFVIFLFIYFKKM
jgi:hypothetical protein